MSTNSESIHNVPFELYYHYIFPHVNWDVSTICALARTSKWAYQTIRLLSQQKPDFNFKGERCVFPCDENTTAKECVLKILRVEVLEESREHIANAQFAVAQAGKNPNDIACLLEYAHSCDFIVQSPQGFSHNAKIHIIASILPFDLQIGKLNADKDLLGSVLQMALINNNICLAQLVLAHTERENIKGASDDMTNNLGACLTASICAKNPMQARQILLLPNANDILAYEFGRHDCLVYALVKAIERNYIEIAELILDHQNAAEIPGNSSQANILETLLRTLSSALHGAVAINNPKLVRKIVALPNAKDIPLVGFIGLGLQNALTKATKSGDPELIAAVLEHPNIIALPFDILFDAIQVAIPDEDKKVLLELLQLLKEPISDSTTDKSLSILGRLSVKSKHYLFMLLGKPYGDQGQDIDDNGTAHFIANLHSLAPYLEKLIN